MNGLLRQKEIAKEMGVSVMSIWRWEREGMPVAHRSGTLVLYSKSKVRRWLKEERGTQK